MSDETERTDEFVARAMARLPHGKPSAEFKERLWKQTAHLVVERGRARRRLKTIATHFSSFAAGLATLMIWQSMIVKPSSSAIDGGKTELARIEQNQKSNGVPVVEQQGAGGTQESSHERDKANLATKGTANAGSVPVAAKDDRLARIESLKRDAERKIRTRGDFAAATRLFTRAAELCRAEELEECSANDHWLWTSIKTTKREESINVKKR